MSKAPSTVIRVGAKPKAFTTLARFWDGRSAEERIIELKMDEELGALRLARYAAWPLGDIRLLPDQAGGKTMLLRSAKDDARRVEIEDPAAQRILRSRCANLHKRVPFGGLGRLFIAAIAAAASVAVMILFLIPLLANQLAEVLPPEGEKALGDQTFTQIAQVLSENDLAPLASCTGAEGQAALDAIEARLTADLELPYPLTVHVLDHPMINAFALPGGHVILFQGLLDDAADADEVAAVFAHELGHVVARDPVRIALRSAGSIGILGLLFGDFAGGSVALLLADRMIQADYSQEAEAAADVFATQMLIDANLDPSALGRLFARWQEQHGSAEGFGQHLASHPSLRARAEAAKDLEKPADYTPALSPEAFEDLQQICG